MAHVSIVTITLVCLLFNYCLGCTLPTNIRGAWISSEKDDLVFATDSMSGYQVATFTTDNFTCINNSGDNYLLKSSTTFSRFGLQFYAYLCLSFNQVSSQLYYYYKHSEEEVDANNERVIVKLAALTEATLSEVCTVTNLTGVPYSMLMANGSQDSVKTTCPIPFLGDFSYSYDTGSGNLCPNESDLQVCDGSKDTLTFNYTYCSQIQAYSAGGVLSCIYSTTDTDNVYTLHVYNEDASTDQSTTYSFTCYKAFGYSTVYVTQYPGDCPSTMNYTYVESPGAALVFNASAYSDDDSSDALSAGVIAAIVILCFLLVLVIVIAIVYYFYMKRKKRKQAEWEEANRKVDPDELSPNMRLGLPNESKYDLDRLMYTPDMKNGLIKRSPRKDMVGLEGLEGYNDGEKYLNENDRQTVLESQLFAEKRKRKDAKDEFNAAKRQNHIYSARILDLAKGKKRPIRAAALAKLKLKPKARPMTNTTDGSDGRATQTKDVVIQVEEADGEAKRKTRFADEEDGPQSKTPKPQPKKLEDVETLSDIVDNENAVDDLSDDDSKEPRLILPKLVPDKSPKKKRPKDRFFLGKSPPTQNMPHNQRFMAPKPKRQDVDELDFIEPAPLHRGNPNFDRLHPLARIHRKDNPKAWKDAFGDKNGMESMDIETLKSQLPENRWKKLLEELYKDKKYFDYVKTSSSVNDAQLFSKADESLQYLYGRALFWENQEPIPKRPPSHVKRMFSRHETPNSSTRKIQRSSTTLPRSGHKPLPRTPSTQVSKMKRREKAAKNDKNAANQELANGTGPLVYFEGGTQTDFSPIPPLTPLEFEHYIERVSLPGSTIDEQSVDDAIQPITKELTKSDIKLEEYDGLEYIGEEENDLPPNEDVIMAI